MLWTSGKFAAYLLQTHGTTWSAKWAGFLAHHGICCETYEWTDLEWPYVVYMKVAIDLKKVYIGSTKCSLPGREATRRRTLRQRGPNRAEPAVVWWRRRRNYLKFATILVSKQPTELQARKLEKQSLMVVSLISTCRRYTSTLA